jgi:hypothetical protein
MTYDDSSTGDGMLVGRMSPDIAEMVNVVNFTVLPTDIEHGTRFIIPTTQSFAGLFIYKKAMALVKNTGA